MKKIFALLTILTLFLTSCGSSDFKNRELTVEIMKERYPEMFLVSEEECGHPYLFYAAIDGMNLDLSADEYHFEYCIYPNCEHENRAVPHSDRWRIKRSGASFKFPDGYFYHPTLFECADCGQQISVFLRCRRGISECHEYMARTYNDIYSLEEWEQIALGNKSLIRELNEETNR